MLIFCVWRVCMYVYMGIYIRDPTMVYDGCAHEPGPYLQLPQARVELRALRPVAKDVKHQAARLCECRCVHMHQDVRWCR